MKQNIMNKAISQIYDEYKIMRQLREHMFRVSAVAELICDNFDGELAKKNIIEACLLHDLGNIVKFKFENLIEFLKPEGAEYWKNVQKEFIEKYGANEHLANFNIIKELGITGKTFDFLESITGSSNGVFNVNIHDDWDVQICKYADFRVGPYGVLSIRDRLDEWQARNQNINKEFAKNAYQIFNEIEKEIFAKCKIKPEDITDEAIKSFLPSLKDFVIHSSDSGSW